MRSNRQKTGQILLAIFVPLVAGVAMSGLLASRVAASGEFSDKRRESIVHNCSSIKTRLKQIQTGDASVRVVLGQNYESMLTKLMDAMNSRLAANRLNSGELSTIAADFSKNLGYFRKNYISYDQKIDELRATKCEKSPQKFYEQLESARKLRAELRFNYDKLDELIDRYQIELDSVWGQHGTAK
jgi:hypothetical protein